MRGNRSNEQQIFCTILHTSLHFSHIPSLHFPHLPSEILLVKPVFPLPSIGCNFVLYKSISGRPNSLKHTQEGLLLFWLQKSLFHLFHPFIETCQIRLPLLLSLISYYVCHVFSGSAEKTEALPAGCILTVLFTDAEILSFH